MKAVVFTLGCKVNEVESAKIMAELEQNGWQTDDKLGYADVYILNTCAVTREAEKKSRQLMARVKKYNPGAEIYVCGCASQKQGKAFWERGAKYVCGTADKFTVTEAVCGKAAGGAYPKQTKTRAFIKIQDGCNNFCSYCIIPYLRGREVSRSPQDILGEISNTSCPEIVLNGINISSYNYCGKDLAGLAESLKDVKARIRMGSLECTVISDRLLTAFKNLYDFAPQFHLSLQSGSDKVLKAMNRHYSREEYLKKCELIYKYFPEAAITTDIISGFPTEEEEDFAQSLSIIKEAGFARVHCFNFSPREGTAAYKLAGLPASVKNERVSALIAAAKVAENEYISRFLGKSLYFIAEEYADGYTTGYTGNYIKIYLPQNIGGKRKVKLISPYNDGALSEIIDD